MNYSSIKRRIFAYLLDMILNLSVSFAVALLIGIILSKTIAELILLAYAILGVVVLISVIFDIFNHIILASIKKGKSIGKALAGIRVVKETGENATFKTMLGRYSIFLLLTLMLSTAILVVDLILMRLNSRKQTTHDQLAKTVVIYSKTSKVKVLAVIYFIVVSIGLLISAVAGYSLAKNWTGESLNTSSFEDEPSAVSLSGIDGPLASFPIDIMLDGGRDEYYSAEALTEKDDFKSAKQEILKAEKLNADSIGIKTLKCYIYMSLSLPEALNVCMQAYNITPNNPALISNTLQSAYQIEDCQTVEDLATVMSNLRMGKEITNYDKELYYGNTGIFMTECSLNPEMAKKFLESAHELSTSTEDKVVYRQYLDYIESLN
jgi:uncharacterized RDD family membrane protein YckC